MWLRAAVGTHGGPVAVARLSGVPKQTIENYTNNRTRKPNLLHLERVAAALSLSEALARALAESSTSGAPAGDPAPKLNAGLAEDAAPFEGSPRPWSKRDPHDGGRWTVASRVLELAGVLPGDVCEFDFSVAPRPGDVVIAQLYRAAGAVTVLRLWRPPVLLVATCDPSVDATPIALDDTGARVDVLGPMVRLLRDRG